MTACKPSKHYQIHTNKEREKEMKKKAEIKALKNRVGVLEFKEAANGERFILGECIRCVPFRKQEVRWLSKDGKCVVSDYIIHSYDTVVINGNYIEVRDFRGVVAEAYRVKSDVLVDMDVEVYRKAFYPETERKTDDTLKVTHWREGDRVRCIKAYEENYDAVGKEGRIVKFAEKNGHTLIGVRFDDPCKGAHSLDGAVAPNHGWWFSDPAEYLEKL